MRRTLVLVAMVIASGCSAHSPLMTLRTEPVTLTPPAHASWLILSRPDKQGWNQLVGVFDKNGHFLAELSAKEFTIIELDPGPQQLLSRIGLDFGDQLSAYDIELGAGQLVGIEFGTWGARAMAQNRLPTLGRLARANPDFERGAERFDADEMRRKLAKAVEEGKRTRLDLPVLASSP